MMTRNFCLVISGFIFLLTGIIKALNSKQFITHNEQYNLLSNRAILPISIAFIGIESALGIALILNVFPQWIIPSSIALLVGLSVLTLWSTASGRTEDCGCYGGVAVITPKQSILLNLGYISLLVIGWLHPIANHRTQMWQWVLALAVMVVASTMGWISREKPIVDFDRLKAGNRWRYRWLKNAPHDLRQNKQFVVFMSPGCGFCHRWISFLNIIAGEDNNTQVLGVMSISDEAIAEFKQEHRVQFPIVAMDKLLFGYMVDAFPTAILLENGKIVSKWVGVLPPEFVGQIKQYYERLIVSNKQPKQVGSTSNLLSSELTKINFAPQHYYLRVDNFIQTEELNKLQEYTLSQETNFVLSNKIESNYYNASILKSFPQFSDKIKLKIAALLSQQQKKIAIESFIPKKIETQITAYSDGNFSRFLQDRSSILTSSKDLTYIYFFHRQPKTFSGGELVIYESHQQNEQYVRGDSKIAIEPINNSLIIFPSHYLHEILPVRCATQSFVAASFTINGSILESVPSAENTTARKTIPEVAA